LVLIASSPNAGGQAFFRVKKKKIISPASQLQGISDSFANLLFATALWL
jgi:hypothetical protein